MVTHLFRQRTPTFLPSFVSPSQNSKISIIFSSSPSRSSLLHRLRRLTVTAYGTGNNQFKSASCTWEILIIIIIQSRRGQQIFTTSLGSPKPQALQTFAKPTNALSGNGTLIGIALTRMKPKPNSPPSMKLIGYVPTSVFIHYSIQNHACRHPIPK